MVDETLQRHLEVIMAHARRGSGPGAGDEAIARLTEVVGFEPTPSVVALYRRIGEVELMPGLSLLSPAAAAAYYQRRRRVERWGRYWLPVLRGAEDDVVAIDHEPPVDELVLVDGDCNFVREGICFADWLTGLSVGYETGVISEPEGLAF